MSTISASEAFYRQLKDIRIEDFPCGLGPWRQAACGREMKCDGPQCENAEDLLELECSAPYAVDCSWSKEAASLRKIAINTPESLRNPNFVFKHFTTLRIVDKNVNKIDEGILKFVDLKELILSANFINKIDGKNLPKGLEVLELAANNVSDLAALKSANIPSLLHLGLAQNQVSSLSSCSFSPSKWPSLLSLDLSYNNLTDLRRTVDILKNLPVLRNILLIGNPLYLSKCYHGFVIDSMPKLSYLDNNEVSADEKHNFKSFSTITSVDVNSSYITVGVYSISDVKKPMQIEESDVNEYPKIVFKYHVEFGFMKDAMLAEPRVDTARVDVDKVADTAANVSEGDSLIDVHLISTESLLWAEMIEFNFRKTFKICDLHRLRSFLEKGFTVSVVCVKHSYVLEDPKLAEEKANNCLQAADNEKQGGRMSALKDRAKLDLKDGKKSAKSQKPAGKAMGKEKGGKKDNRDFSELFELPQERKVVGTYHVRLASLLDEDNVVRVNSPCLEGPEKAAADTKLQSGKRLEEKKKGKADGEKQSKTSTLTKGKSKSDLGKLANTVGTKGNKSGKTKEKVEECNERQSTVEAPPPPLSVKLEISLERYTATKHVLGE